MWNSDINFLNKRREKKTSKWSNLHHIKYQKYLKDGIHLSSLNFICKAAELIDYEVQNSAVVSFICI